MKPKALACCRAYLAEYLRRLGKKGARQRMLTTTQESRSASARVAGLASAAAKRKAKRDK